MSSFRNPFKGHTASKKSAISRTAEREYEREFKRIEQLDEHSRKIYKDMKHCIEAQAAQCKSESKLTSDLLNGPLCREDAEFKEMVEKWAESTHKLEQHMNELNYTSHKAVSEPMKKFCAIYPSLQAASKKREASLQELNRWQAKQDKYNERERTGQNRVKLQQRERTGQNRVKLQQSQKSLTVAKEDYGRQNSALMEDMPRLYDLRTNYIEPSFKALVKAQIKYYTEAHQLYAEQCSRLEHEDQDAAQLNKILDEITALTITKDK